MRKLFANIVISFSVILLAAGSASADDLWCETPDLENITTLSFAIEPSRLSNKAPDPGIWDETPAREYDNGNEYGIKEKSKVRNIPAPPDMYSETPDRQRIANFLEKSAKKRTSSNFSIHEVLLHSDVKGK